MLKDNSINYAIMWMAWIFFRIFLIYAQKLLKKSSSESFPTILLYWNLITAFYNIFESTVSLLDSFYLFSLTCTYAFILINYKIHTCTYTKGSSPSLLTSSELINFYFPWNYQKTYGFLMISGGEIKLINSLKFA